MADGAAGAFENHQPHETPCRPTPRTREQVLWESVLIETADAEKPDLPLGFAERKALRDVARRYQGQAMALQPVAAALVQAVILPQLPADSAAAKFWQDVFGKIAQSQLDDQSARNRLEAIWNWLQGGPAIDAAPSAGGQP